ncbi:MAG: sulfite exporter TauE/SafE family protein [Clostridia bacterium]|nr:sulfite exporter TauE/SafE family protein [Clostridia bacterium]
MPYLSEFLVLLLSIPLGLGVGSGGFFLVYLSDVLALPHESAVYLNLVFFISAILASAFIHLRARRLCAPLLLLLLLFGVPAAFVGRAVAALLPKTVLRFILGFFLIGSGIFAIKGQKKRSSPLTNKGKSAIITFDKENTR